MAENELKRLCQRLAGTRESGVIALVLPNEPLLPKHLLDAHARIADHACKKVDVVLHSSGGDINTAYQIIETLRRHCRSMATIVPIYAKSAASLFLLASDEIIMGELAELGPLDTQIVEREKGARKYRSALNPFKTLEELQKFSLETLDLTVKLVLGRAELSIDEAIKHGIDFAAKTSASLFTQLDIEKVGEYSRALAVGKEYGDRLLRRHLRWRDKHKRDQILEKIVRRYPSHDYIIDYEEVQELGFNVRLPSDEEKPIIDGIVKHVLGSSETEILCALPPKTPAKRKRTSSLKKKGAP